MHLPTKAAILGAIGDTIWALTLAGGFVSDFAAQAGALLSPQVKYELLFAGIGSGLLVKYLQRIVERIQGKQDAANIAVTQEAIGIAPVEPSAPVNPPTNPPGVQSGMASLVGAAMAALFVLHFAGCASMDPATKAGLSNAGMQALTEAEGVLGQVAMSTLFNAAQQELSGGKVNYQQAAAAGLWANVNVADTGGAIMRVVNAYGAGKTSKTALAAKNAFDAVAADERSPEIVNAIATVISTAAGAPPK